MKIILPVANLCKVEVLIDKKDKTLYDKYNWQIQVYGPSVRVYAIVTKKVKGKNVNKTIYLHRYLTKCPKNKVVDHKNGNCLDNRRKNLRICTQSQNIRNSNKTRSKTSSKYKGVYYNSSRKKWTAQICKNYRRYYLGDFDFEFLAAAAYDKKAVALFGKYAKTNLLRRSNAN